jgi:hypothetical protein
MCTLGVIALLNLVGALYPTQAGAQPTYWSLFASPSPGDQHNDLSGVACTSSTDCVAVGYDGSGASRVPQSLVESWDGATWSTVPSAQPGTTGSLSGVSCISAAACIAVGGYGDASGIYTMVQQWNGNAWSLVPSPSPGTELDNLTGVSCTSSMDCVAVGASSDENNGGDQTLVESWDGNAWSVVPSPNPSTDDELNGVSCTSSTWCVAVGFDQGKGLPITESWDGSSWSVTSNPGAAGPLYGVSCTSSSSCMAVGGSNPEQGTMALAWDGTSWTALVTPPAGDTLEGVSCPNTTDCVAVGYSDGSPSLIEAWDGSAWSISPNPSPGSYSNTLSAVSCSSPTTCAATGNTWSNTQTFQTLAEIGYAPVIATGGAQQAAVVNVAFSFPLKVEVTDIHGNPVSGAAVTFTAPSTGASGAFANGTTTDTETTDANGVATSSTFSANSVAGSYTVDASVAGISASAAFALTNAAGAPTSITASNGSAQSTPVDSAFPLALTAQVSDSDGNPISGATVTFAGPSSGASGTFANGTTSDTETTDANGMATSSTFSATSMAGSYTVDASVAGVSTPATFALTNAQAASIAESSGSAQSSPVGTAFGDPLTAEVVDTDGNPMPRASVTFTAPSTGASGAFANGTTTDTETTDANGMATSSTFSANSVAGSYTVDASVAGVSTPATFALTNTQAASIAASSGSAQSTLTRTAFPDPLTAEVVDTDGNPMPRASVTFTAPSIGASGTFANGMISDTTITNANGIATSSTFKANQTMGSYAVDASVAGVSVPATFTMTNIQPPPTIGKFSPTKGATHTKVTITGQNLSPASSVVFHGVSAAILTDSRSRITTKVPKGATTGPVEVITPGGTATSAKRFKVK